MYRKFSKSWLKHWDFILLDSIILQIVYMLSYFMRNGIKNPYNQFLYLNIGIIIFLSSICTAFFMDTYHGILRRGNFEEFKIIVKQMIFLGLIETSYLFISKNGDKFSRSAFFCFIMLSVVLLYLERILWKQYLLRSKTVFYRKRKMLVVVSSEEADTAIETICLNSYNEFEIIGIVLAEQKELLDKKIKGIPVVCTLDTVHEYMQGRWIDSIFINLPRTQLLPEKFLNTCVSMGVTVHRRIAELQEDGINVPCIEKVGGYFVLTSSLCLATIQQLFLKRLLDICGGFIGVVMTGILTLFLAPAIYLASPGPIFFSQTRIGKNGRKFKIYKFRSMYMNAEERKKDLLKRNEMQGLMFKMENDPRIIGSGSDGTKHGLGWFIRKTSLDEFPQFWNVLKGEMSLVGTRPPTVDEWEQYEYHHRARMAAKPGLTGIWQVSGRSDITNFEEIVKMDTYYIQNWNIGMDIRILLKTVFVVLFGIGSR